jgi:hypothetical protein
MFGLGAGASSWVAGELAMGDMGFEHLVQPADVGQDGFANRV